MHIATFHIVTNMLEYPELSLRLHPDFEHEKLPSTSAATRVITKWYQLSGDSFIGESKGL